MDTKQQTSQESAVFSQLVTGNPAATPSPTAPECSRATTSGKISAVACRTHGQPGAHRDGESGRIRSKVSFEKSLGPAPVLTCQIYCLLKKMAARYSGHPPSQEDIQHNH